MNKTLSNILLGLVSTTVSVVALASGANAAMAPTPGGLMWEREDKTVTNGFTSTAPFIQFVDGSTRFDSAPLTNSNQQIVGMGKFGGKSKIIIRTDTNGGQLEWADADRLDQTFTAIGVNNLNNYGGNGANFQFVGAADFDGDGTDDIVLRAQNTAETGVWLMNPDGTIKASKAIAAASSQFEIVAVGQLQVNNGGLPDLLWRDLNDGRLVKWTLIDDGNGGYTYDLPNSGYLTTTLTFPVADYNSRIGGDIDGDGDTDMLFHKKSDNSAVVVKMEGGQVDTQFATQTYGPYDNMGGTGGTTPTDFVPVGIYANKGVENFILAPGTITKAAPTLGNLDQDKTIVSNAEVFHHSSGAGQPSYAFFTFTLTQARDITITFDSSNVKGFGSDVNGNAAGWGVIGSSNSNNPNYNQRTGKFNLGPGTYYYRVESGIGGANKRIPFSVTFTSQAPGTTAQVTDIDPGTLGSDILGGVTMGPNTYFLAKEGTNRGLWKTDGTPGGTTLVKSLVPSGSEIVENNGVLYFTAVDPANGTGSLFKSDGTEAGTVLVKNIQVAGEDAAIAELTIHNGDVYFVADDGGSRDIWKTNGTEAGTTKQVDFGGYDAQPSDLISFNGSLLYVANADGNGRRLWRYSGSTPVVVSTDANLLNFQELTTTGNALYATAVTDGSDGDIELIRVKTDWSTTKIDVLSGAESSNPVELFAWGNDVYFSAIGSNGRELYRANSSSPTATLIYDFYTGTDTEGNQNNGLPSNFEVFDNVLFFRANDGTNGAELWKYTGSGNPTRVSQIASGADDSLPYAMTVSNGKLYFVAKDGDSTNANYELYKMDSATSTPTLVKEINPGTDGSFPINLQQGPNGKLIFTAQTNADGFEPYATDGSSSGTVQLSNINTVPQGSIQEGVELNGWSYFSAHDKDKGQELYRTNGSTTELVSDINPGKLSSNPINLVADSNWVYFNATKEGVSKLWRSNGTVTEVAHNINAADESDAIGNIEFIGGDLHFVGVDINGNVGLYKTNNLYNPSFNVSVVKDFGSAGAITEMRAFSDEIWLTAAETDANGEAVGFKTYRVDSNGNVTTIDKLDTGEDFGGAYEYVQTDNGKTFFAAISAQNGYELHMVEPGGTTAKLVADINTASGEGSNLTALTALGNIVFFGAYDGTQLRYYRTDGTTTTPDVYLNLDEHFQNQPGPVTNQALEYRDYLSLTPVVSSSGKSVVTASKFLSKIYWNQQSTGICGYDDQNDDNNLIQTGRQLLQSYEQTPANPASDFMLTNAESLSAYPNSGLGGSTPGSTYTLTGVNGLLSVQYGPDCLPLNNNGGTYKSVMPDARVSTFESVKMASVNGKLYIAGTRTQNGGVEIWVMDHSESFRKALGAFGMPVTRTVQSLGLYDIDFNDAELKQIGNEMYLRGYDQTSKTNKQWKL